MVTENDRPLMPETCKNWHVPFAHYDSTDMNSYEVQRYAKLYAYFNKPLSDALNLKPTATERKNAWEMSNEEFDNYINGILDIN